MSCFGYANGTAKGVAPHAKIAVYKVSWSEGISAPDVISGIDQAIADGVDVICVPLGSQNTQLFKDPIAIASFSAMEKGILVSTATGNDGPSYNTLSNGVPWVLTVTSGTIDRWFGGTLTLENGLHIIGWSMFPGETMLQKLPIVYNNAYSKCNSSALLSKATPGRIILCDIGNLTNQIESINASKIVGAIVISNNPIVAKKIPCACIVINLKDAKVLLGYVNSTADPLVTMEFRQTPTYHLHQLSLLLLQEDRHDIFHGS